MLGLRSRRVDFREVVFGVFRVEVLWPICLWRFVMSTVSESNSPRVPTPAPARYNAKGHPIPPAPINPIFASTIFTWPVYPIYFSSICLEYLARRSPKSTGLRFVCNGPSTNFCGLIC
jgi:hypothetical protein